MTNVTIKQTQHLLAYLGYYVGSVDGIWGTLSRTACKAFQQDFYLTADGVAGPETQKALKHAVAYDMTKPDTPEPDSTGDFWADIPSFTRQEFACKCGQYCDGFPAEPQEAMVRLAQAARTHFGRPATIVSGLRCQRHNANVGGVADSQHMYGEACDLTVSGVSADRLLAFLQSQPGVRYAYKINETNVHFDIPKGDR